MNKILNYFKEYGWCLWLGMSPFVDTGSLVDWRWWAFSIPLILLVGLSSAKYTPSVKKLEKNKQKEFDQDNSFHF